MNNPPTAPPAPKRKPKPAPIVAMPECDCQECQKAAALFADMGLPDPARVTVGEFRDAVKARNGETTCNRK